MIDEVPDWLATGSGVRPKKRWSFATDAPLVCLELSRETGEVLAADESGGMYLLDRNGKIVTVTRGFPELDSLAWSDNGTHGVALVGDSQLFCFNRQLKILWSLELHDTVLAIAVDPYGHHIAVSLANGENLILNTRKKRVSDFETVRPLSFLEFVVTETALLGAAEHGLLCCHDLDGTEIWSEKLWSNVGDLCATGNGEALFVAGFSHGIQRFEADGSNSGSYVIEGTPNHISSSFTPKRLVATTVERQIYWLTTDGELLWAANLPDDVCQVRCDALGNWIACGFRSGRIMRLDW